MNKVCFKIFIKLIQFILLLPSHLIMGLLCWILSPILPLFAIGKDKLPKYLSWFQTPDAPLDGDSGFNDPIQHPIITRLPRYIRRSLWLIRNPAYGYAWTVLAYQPKTPEYVWKGSYRNGETEGSGWFFMFQNDGHFQFCTRQKYLFNRYFYFRFGWKILGLATHKGDNYLEKKKFVFTLNPIDKE